jgi:hypothetical protein
MSSGRGEMSSGRAPAAAHRSPIPPASPPARTPVTVTRDFIHNLCMTLWIVSFSVK